MTNASETMRPLMELAPVIPVLRVDSVETAVPLARALVAGGLPLLEITLRTDAALDAIRAIGQEVEGATVGAGTVLDTAQWAAATEAGARFIVSPGATADLLSAAAGSEIPLLPGAATASEIMTLRDHGYRYMKFFPAEPAGGVAYLKALSAPLPEAVFCPTGGIDVIRARDYLALPNVICVGGSWVAPADAIRGREWDRVTKLARTASVLRPA